MQSDGTCVCQSSMYCAIFLRTYGAYGETMTPVWSPYATVCGRPRASSTATSFAATPGGSACIVGEVGLHQLRFPYGMTRSPSPWAAAIMALKSDVVPNRGSGGRKSGSFVSNGPIWKPTGWSKSGDGRRCSSFAHSRNGVSSGRFAFSIGASAYVSKRAPSLLCSDGYASIPLSCR